MIILSYNKGLVFFFLLTCLSTHGISQEKDNVTFYGHIEPIIQKNCTPCHRPGQAGPFSLVTFEDISKKGTFIASVTKSR
jgi:hypothetical protein